MKKETTKPLRYVAHIAPLMATLLVSSASVSQAEVIFRIGFEASEYRNADVSQGGTLWGRDGSTTHGKSVPLDGTTTRAGSFSIPGHSTRCLIDDSNARSGTQSVRLSESVPDNYNWVNVATPGALDEIENSTLPVRIAYSNYRAQTGDDLRSNGFQTSHPSSELWQLRIAGDGNVSVETGRGTFASNPGDLVGWYDFELDVNFTRSRIIGARFRAPGQSGFTELITRPLVFKNSIAATTFAVLTFRPDNTGVSADTAWDDISIVKIPEPNSSQAEMEPDSLKPNQSGPAEPHWELFLDDHILARSTGFKRVLHHPKPSGIVLKPDKPWETFGVTPWYVGRRKDGSFECYYQTLWHARGFATENRIAYATSRDAIHWEKPVLNMVDGPNDVSQQSGLPLGLSIGSGKANNILPCGHPRDLLLYGNLRDPEKRYALGLNFGIPQRIAFCKELPDFINDPNWQEKLVDSGGFIHSHYTTLQYWDAPNEEWVVMRQAPNHPPTRVSGRYASPDLKNWTLDHCFYPDAQDSSDPRYFHEVYGLTSVYLEGIVIGFPAWFIGDETNPETTNDRGLIGTDTNLGTMEVRLVISRDGGKTWDRTVSREAWIPHGTEHDSYDRMVRLDCPPLRMGDEDWFYGTVGDGDHGMRADGYGGRSPLFQGALYKQKHNRYVSLTAGNRRPQILITKQIEVTGKSLQLNVDASRGVVKVAIGIDKLHESGGWPFKANLPHWMVQDRWGQSHLEKGFHFDDCEAVKVDNIEHNVEWKNADLESLMGKKVRLYIMVQDADLYGLRFK